MRAAVYMDGLRRSWSPHVVEQYAKAIDQYIRWLRRTDRVDAQTPVAPTFVWRSGDQDVVVHSSIFFEHAMVHLTAGLMKSVQRLPCDKHFETARRSLGDVITYRGDTASAYAKHFVDICQRVCRVRTKIADIGDEVRETDIAICKEALNTLPAVPIASELYSYCSELKHFLAERYCTAYAAHAASEERFDEAEAAMSALGDEHPLRVKYGKLRMSVMQKKIPFDTWLFSITDEEITEKNPVENLEVAPLFDDIDVLTTHDEITTSIGEAQEHDKL